MRQYAKPKTVASTRPIKIFEHLCTDGPATLGDVVSSLGGTKTTNWRALGHLVNMGWIHRRFSDGRYMVSNHLDSLLAMADVALPEQQTAEKIVRTIASSRSFTGRIGMLASNYQYSVLDGNTIGSRDYLSSKALDLVGFSAAVSFMRSEDQARTIDSFLKHVPSSNRIEVKEEIEYLLGTKLNGTVFAAYNLELAAPFRFRTGSIGSVVLRARSVAAANWPRVTAEGQRVLQVLIGGDNGSVEQNSV